MVLDRETMQILAELELNSRQSLRELSKKTGLPMSTIHARVKKLEREKVIRGYSAVIDPARVDKTSVAFVFVSIRGGEQVGRSMTQRQIATQLSANPLVQEVYIVTGDWDLLLKVRAKDTQAVGSFVVDHVREIKGVEKTLTLYSFEAIKDRGQLAST